MPPAGRRTDDGISLVELILAVALLGTAAVTLLGAFGTLIKTADSSKKNGDLTTTLAAASDFLVARTKYLDCATKDDYNAAFAGFTKPDTIGAITVDTVQYWDGNADPAGAFGDQCHDTVKFWRLQQITLRVATTGGAERLITVVKRG